MDSSDAREGSTQNSNESETPACQSCRSRKLRCSRNLPACNRCKSLGVECHYDYTRNKPGVKIGIIQTLTHRVEILEAEVRAVRAEQRPVNNVSSSNSPDNDLDNIRGLVSSLMEEWWSHRSLSEQPLQRSSGQNMEIESNSESSQPNIAVPESRTSQKRRRHEDNDSNEQVPTSHLPPNNLVEAILDAYFSVVHPFIPIIHEMLFRSRLRDPSEKSKLVIILHAMVVCAMRYVANERLATEWLELYPTALQRSFELVLLSGMGQLSVENAQALVIVAFVHIGDGTANKAWPIIGMLARAVVFLGLHKEPEENHMQDHCLKPLWHLPPPRVWTEAEERRRVFWNVFLLDRFCSMVTGWNMSLSSEDVQVRLPSDGLYWVKEEPVITPFLNIWDTSMAKIGKSVSFLPSHFFSLSDRDKDDGATASTSERISPVSQSPEKRNTDLSTIGSFAYCVEATESLNRVVKYFLQRPVDFKNKHQFSAWLTRFKELDLQLIHWKMFLPRRWKDSNISKEPAFVHMDPNLTLAHITHNTSMILLHQTIAYPHNTVFEKLRSVSSGSAETCQLAASETANIVQKYLQYTPFVGLVSPQFSFCAFLSARVLLVHSHIHNSVVPEAYHVLLSSLQQMSDRWISMNPGLRLNCEVRSFAGNLLDQLQALQNRDGPPFLSTSSMGYVAEVNTALGIQMPDSNLRESQWIEERRGQQRHSIIPVSERQSHYISGSRLRPENSQQSPFNNTLHTPSSGSFHSTRFEREDHFSAGPGAVPSQRGPTPPPQERMNIALDGIFPEPQATLPLGNHIEGLGTLSDFLLDPQYVDMDRIISFQDSIMRR